jgi:hypothetical protein
VLRVDEATGVITTTAQVDTPTGLAVVSRGDGVAVYVSDSRNNRIHVIEPDGIMGTLPGVFVTPTRIAYHPAGWLYVKDGSPDGVTAVAVSARRRE